MSNATIKVKVNMKLRKRSAATQPANKPLSPSTPAPTYIASGIFADGQWKMDAPDFEEAVKAAFDAKTMINALKAELDAAESKIVELAEHVSGDREGDLDVSGYGYDVKVKRRNQYRWDSKKLSELFNSHDTLPTHVKNQLSVDRKVYERLDDATKNILRPALNVINQKPSLNITRSN